MNKGKLVIDGWTRDSDVNIESALRRMERAEIGGILVTDIGGDGMDKGILKQFFAEMRAKTSLPLIASGGVSSLEDVRALAELGYEYAVIGRALYEKKFPLKDAIKAAGNVG